MSIQSWSNYLSILWSVGLLAQTWAQPVLLRHCRQRIEGDIIVVLCTLYCNVFLLVNEMWSNLTALHSTLHQRHLSLPRWSTCTCSCVLEEAWLWRVICRESFKARLLLLAFSKSPTLPLTLCKVKSCVFVKSIIKMILIWNCCFQKKLQVNNP